MFFCKRWTLQHAAAVGLAGLVATGAAAQNANGEQAAAVEKLYVINCGYITANKLSIFSTDDAYKGQSKELTDSCFLIQHEKGTLLWDAGLPDALAEKSGGTEAGDGAFTLRVDKPLKETLKEIDLEPTDIDYLAMSHMHFDHTGNANDYATATWLVPEAEYALAFGDNPEKYFFDPKSYNKLKDAETVKYDGDYDVFGDGSVMILAAPGHTPGHQTLLVRLADTGPVMISGDLYHFTKNRTFRRVPSFNFDVANSRISIERMEDLASHHNAQLWIQHDKEQIGGLKHAPEFYE